MHRFFPDSYMLSQAVMRILYTGGDAGEVLTAVDALTAMSPDQRVAGWPSVWAALADGCAERAAAAAAGAHDQTARSLFFRACAYYQWAASFGGQAGGRDGRELHQVSRAMFTEFAGRCDPEVELVEVPYEGAAFPAAFVPAQRRAGRSPAVVYLPGWDSTKEQGLQLAEVLAERGFATLLCDGPGIGEALHERGMVNRYDYEVPGSAAVDYLLSRGDVDPRGLFVVGSSLGGYRAARMCAFEQRVAGLVVWGAMWDFQEAWLSWNRAGASPTRGEHAVRALGVATIDDVPNALATWKLETVASAIHCPVLILHGELDSQVPVRQAQALLSAVSSESKELRLYPAGKLGAAHCQNDHREIAHTDIGDWLADTWSRIEQS